MPRRLGTPCVNQLAGARPYVIGYLRGQAIAAAFKQRDAEAFMRIVDTDAFAGSVLGDFNLSKKDASDIRQRMPVALQANVGASMRSIEKSNGSAKFLRGGGVEGGKPYALVRLDLGDNGVDYVKYYVSRQGAVEDWYVFTAASQLSAQVRFNLAFMLKSDSLLFALFGARSVSQTPNSR